VCLVCGGTQQVRHEQQTLTAAIANGAGKECRDRAEPTVNVLRGLVARATTLMEGGEKAGIQMPFGCRMGIYRSCVLPLESGYVRDRIQMCISAASGDCTIDI
jgi:stearoyl-CoA 9-desaturase NADPH oxidoreductase